MNGRALYFTLLASVLGTCVLIPVLLISLRWTRAFMVGWLLFFVALSPTLLVFGYSLGIAADKYAYLPCIGFLLIIAWLLGRSFEDAAPRTQVIKRLLAVLCVVFVLSLLEAIATRRYLVCWNDTESLYNHMVARAPGVPTLCPTIG